MECADLAAKFSAMLLALHNARKIFERHNLDTEAMANSSQSNFQASICSRDGINSFTWFISATPPSLVPILTKPLSFIGTADNDPTN